MLQHNEDSNHETNRIAGVPAAQNSVVSNEYKHHMTRVNNTWCIFRQQAERDMILFPGILVDNYSQASYTKFLSSISQRVCKWD